MRRSAGWLAAGTLALIAGATVARPFSPVAPALYDGFITQAPYRLLCSPDAGQAHPPQGHTETDAVENGKSPAIAAATAEVNAGPGAIPQFQFLSGTGNLVIPSGAPSVVVTMTPVPPPATLPRDGTIDGNVYRLALTAGGQPVTQITPGQLATIVLRGLANGDPNRVVERFDGSAWARVDTVPVGQQDVFGANIQMTGDFALVTPGAAAAPGACVTSATPGTDTTGGSSSGGAESSAAHAGAPIAGGTAADSGAPVGALVALGGVLIAGAAVLVWLRRPSSKPPRRRPPPGGADL